jgi:thymidylate synthase ThyX
MYDCKIILDSISPMGARLTTFEVTFPRIVLAEFNTHRMFSRNSASSRAIPVEKQIKRVEDDCFVPIYWGKNQKGMQAEHEFDDEGKLRLSVAWRSFAGLAIRSTKELLGFGVHKQITNRLLEPFMWHTVIVTATEWRNFFALRDHKMAQPEIQRAATMMRKCYAESKPQILAHGEWHLPLVTNVDLHTLSKVDGLSTDELIQISCARCARVSYLTHDGKRDPKADLDMYNGLKGNGHMSPLEHAAQALDHQEWRRIAREQAHNWIEHRVPVGNFYGWLQHRKMVASESEFPREDIFWNEAA